MCGVCGVCSCELERSTEVPSSRHCTSLAPLTRLMGTALDDGESLSTTSSLQLAACTRTPAPTHPHMTFVLALGMHAHPRLRIAAA